MPQCAQSTLRGEDGGRVRLLTSELYLSYFFNGLSFPSRVPHISAFNFDLRFSNIIDLK